MKLFPAALALLALAGSVSVVRADATSKSNPFSAPSSISIERNGLVFELHLPEGKTRFQQGETIPVILSFSNRGEQTLCLDTFHYSPPSWAVFASFAAEPRAGVINPLGDLPPVTAFSYNGPPPPKPQVLGTKPVGVRLVLNEYLRFDRPGTYQIRATTSHVFAVEKGKPAPREGSFFSRGEAVTSSPLSIEIVPADPQWQQQQVAAWRTFWSKQKPAENDFGWSTPSGVTPPANDLRFLNTRAAAQAMIHRLGQDIAPRSSGSEAYFWRSGLLGFSDRLWLIGAMKSAIKQPNYAVTQGLLDNLAELQALYHVPRGGKKTPNQQFWKVTENSNRFNWQLAFDSLAAKKGAARAMTVHSLLETAWLSRLEKQPEVQRALPRLVEMVPDIFNDLPELPQQYLLDDRDNLDNEWQKVKSPRFVAPLLRAWKTVPHAEGWGMERGNLILRHLYELDPQAARPLILKEMAAPRSRVDFQVLCLLKDKYLPQIQDIWWRNLNSNGADQDIAARLIGRYATRALKTKVQQEYAQRKRDDLLSYDVNRGLKQYLLRVGG